MGLLHTVSPRAVKTGDDQYIQEEITYLRRFLQNNGYAFKNVNQAIRRA